MEKLSKKLKALRLEQNWTQSETAEKLEISVAAYCKIENGITDINITRLNQLAEIYKLSSSELLSDDVSKNKSSDTKLMVKHNNKVGWIYKTDIDLDSSPVAFVIFTEEKKIECIGIHALELI